MGFLDKIFGQGPEDIKRGVEQQQEEVFPILDIEGDTADGDTPPEALTMEHDFESVLRAHPELRPKKPEGGDGQFE